MENFEDQTFQSFQTIATEANENNDNYAQVPDTSTVINSNDNTDYMENNMAEAPYENPKSVGESSFLDASNRNFDGVGDTESVVKNSEVSTSSESANLNESYERMDCSENVEPAISSTENTDDKSDADSIQDKNIENTVEPSNNSPSAMTPVEQGDIDADNSRQDVSYPDQSNSAHGDDYSVNADSSRADEEVNQDTDFSMTGQDADSYNASENSHLLNSRQDEDSIAETAKSIEDTPQLSEIDSCVPNNIPSTEAVTNTEQESKNDEEGNACEDVTQVDKDQGIDDTEKPSSTEATPVDGNATKENTNMEEGSICDTQTTSNDMEVVEDTDQAKDNTAELSTSTSPTEDKVTEEAGESTDHQSTEENSNALETSSSAEKNTEFVQVNAENESLESGKDTNKRSAMEDDPIASDNFDNICNDDREGADEELCIIPDTEREISQAEKDAAATIPPLRDISAASSDVQDSTTDASAQSTESSIIVYKHDKEDLEICTKCRLKRKAMYYYSQDGVTLYICDDNCLSNLKESSPTKIVCNWEEGSLRVKNFTTAAKEPPLAFVRKCASCEKVTDDIENNLTWEIMDFCDEHCLTKYQKEIGSHCSTCKGEVKSNSLGKYCVRFGNDIRQFCTSICLEKYKKGLKVCSYCQQDMSGGPSGFLAPVGDKGQFKDFCSQVCMEKYDIMTNDRPPKVAPGTICSVCKADKPITIEYELNGAPNYFCGEPCFVAFSFVNNISSGKCAMCKRLFSKEILEKFTMYYDNVQHSFCSNSCENIYIIAHRKIVPCSWCKVKKYNFDMIRRYSKTGPMINMCSVNCLSLYRVSLDNASGKVLCNYCQKMNDPVYHLSMSDGTVRNFCSYNCVSSFQGQFPKQNAVPTANDTGFPVPIGIPRRDKRFPIAAEAGMCILRGQQ
ncbi:unnamed protein product [Callosobruchus maculatus]|uniref:TRASH domain-containing protein n=1 Tax=Callosobruchus maculatus TaxID=64391 RepID=A0A653C338_CALMS|nr:unnamed protein product [Callosobruchus maculatus]